MNKAIRERKALILDAGLHLQSIERRRKHVAFVCAEGTVTAATTSSDWREIRNFRATVRRLARG